MEPFSRLFVKILLSIFAVYIIWKFWKFVNQYSQWRKIISDVSVVGPLHPIWGSLHLFKDLPGLCSILTNIAQKEKPRIVCYWLTCLVPGFIVCHPDTAKILLKSSEPKAVNTRGGYSFLINWIGDGLLVSSGKKWERNRKLLTPGFNFNILKPYVNIFNSSTNIFLDNLKQYTRNGKSVDIYQYAVLETLDIILKCAFSYKGDVQKEGENHPYVAAVRRLGQLIIERWMKPWVYMDIIYGFTSSGREYNNLCRYVHDFSDGVIKERRRSLTTHSLSQKRHLDFLDILLTAKDENEVGLSDEDIRDEVDTFLFEGHETTASAISWAIYHLGKYSEEQEKVFQEISDALGDNDQITWEHLQVMPRLTAFIKESLRMVTPVHAVSRLLTSPLKFGHVTIPAGVNVEIALHIIHHHPDVWPDHEIFRPDRFLSEDITNRHPYSFLPFSAGSRNCIGQHFAMDELKVVIGRFVQRYRVALVPDHNYEISPELVMRPKNGMHVILKNR